MRYGNLQEDAEDGEGKAAVQEFVGAGRVDPPSKTNVGGAATRAFWPSETRAVEGAEVEGDYWGQEEQRRKRFVPRVQEAGRTRITMLDFQ